MTCYHPLKGFVLGKKPDGKRDLKIASYEVTALRYDPVKEKWDLWRGDPERLPASDRYITEYIEIPCGKCIGCRLKHSRDWADRCMLELKEHRESWFVTFTYTEQDVVRSVYYDRDRHCYDTSLTLHMKDWQDFMKRLRFHYDKKYPGEKLRFFMCGEYGEKTHRPHYHAILFGLHLDDLTVYSRPSYKRAGKTYSYSLWTSPWLENIWSHGKVIIGNVTWDTCAYVARYITKKLSGPMASIYKDYNFDKEFVLMSRKPGLAKDYYDMHKDTIYRNDEIFYAESKGGRQAKPPAYFDRLLDEESPDVAESVKEQRRLIAEKIRNAKLESTDLTYPELLELEERHLKHNTGILTRDKFSNIL